jgi:hypothetical protein
MKWIDQGDQYVMEDVTESTFTISIGGQAYQYRDQVMRLVPALDQHGCRIGWDVYDLKEQRKLNDEPFVRLNEAKIVASTWWRMR